MIPEACYARASGPADDSDVSHRAHVANLRKHAVGLGGVWFLTVTGSAPISAMLFNVPIMVGFGQGQGAPAAFAHTVAYSHTRSTDSPTIRRRMASYGVSSSAAVTTSSTLPSRIE